MKKRVFAALLALLLLAGCSGGTADSPFVDPVAGFTLLGEESVALAASPAAIFTVAEPSAPGTAQVVREKAKIDYSNTADGYVMAQYTAQTVNRIKVVVKGPTTSYQYNLTPGEWGVFPLSDGEGQYQIGVYENVSGTKYAGVCSVTATVALPDPFAPFLRPNQYVNYSAAPNAVAKAGELTEGMTDPLEMVGAVYEYVVKSLSYDKQRAATVASGYLPVLDDVMAQGKGICFDYAALMTGMLRSQGVPCKLVVGYAGKTYHAWISVWSEKEGWVDAAVYFDGASWQRMDPTFASSANRSEAIMKYIGDGSNYAEKYFY